MRERPILFSGPMVRALLEDRKTRTRRVVTSQPKGEYAGTVRGFGGRNLIEASNGPTNLHEWRMDGEPVSVRACPFGMPGDRLWVRECFSPREYDPEVIEDLDPMAWYWADGNPTRGNFTKPKPSIHMPRWASRITLEITEVRAERLQDITEEDALAEGIQKSDDPGLRSWPFLGADHRIKGTPKVFATAKQAFASLWDSLNAKRGFGWDVNPWVWVVGFRRVEQKAVAA